MESIKRMLEKENPSLADLIESFEDVKNNGDVAVIKFDGERQERQYTVFISFPLKKNKEMIRSDDSNLKSALLTVLRKYVD